MGQACSCFRPLEKEHSAPDADISEEESSTLYRALFNNFANAVAIFRAADGVLLEQNEASTVLLGPGIKELATLFARDPAALVEANRAVADGGTWRGLLQQESSVQQSRALLRSITALSASNPHMLAGEPLAAASRTVGGRSSRSRPFPNVGDLVISPDAVHPRRLLRMLPSHAPNTQSGSDGNQVATREPHSGSLPSGGRFESSIKGDGTALTLESFRRTQATCSRRGSLDVAAFLRTVEQQALRGGSAGDLGAAAAAAAAATGAVAKAARVGFVAKAAARAAAEAAASRADGAASRHRLAGEAVSGAAAASQLSRLQVVAMLPEQALSERADAPQPPATAAAAVETEAAPQAKVANAVGEAGRYNEGLLGSLAPDALLELASLMAARSRQSTTPSVVDESEGLARTCSRGPPTVGGAPKSLTFAGYGGAAAEVENLPGPDEPGSFLELHADQKSKTVDGTGVPGHTSSLTLKGFLQQGEPRPWPREETSLVDPATQKDPHDRTHESLTSCRSDERAYSLLVQSSNVSETATPLARRHSSLTKSLGAASLPDDPRAPAASGRSRTSNRSNGSWRPQRQHRQQLIEALTTSAWGTLMDVRGRRAHRASALSLPASDVYGEYGRCQSASFRSMGCSRWDGDDDDEAAVPPDGGFCPVDVATAANLTTVPEDLTPNNPQGASWRASRSSMAAAPCSSTTGELLDQPSRQMAPDCILGPARALGGPPGRGLHGLMSTQLDVNVNYCLAEQGSGDGGHRQGPSLSVLGVGDVPRSHARSSSTTIRASANVLGRVVQSFTTSKAGRPVSSAAGAAAPHSALPRILNLASKVSSLPPSCRPETGSSQGSGTLARVISCEQPFVDTRRRSVHASAVSMREKSVELQHAWEVRRRLHGLPGAAGQSRGTSSTEGPDNQHGRPASRRASFNRHTSALTSRLYGSDPRAGTAGVGSATSHNDTRSEVMSVGRHGTHATRALAGVRFGLSPSGQHHSRTDEASVHGGQGQGQQQQGQQQDYPSSSHVQAPRGAAAGCHVRNSTLELLAMSYSDNSSRAGMAACAAMATSPVGQPTDGGAAAPLVAAAGGAATAADAPRNPSPATVATHTGSDEDRNLLFAIVDEGEQDCDEGSRSWPAGRGEMEQRAGESEGGVGRAAAEQTEQYTSPSGSQQYDPSDSSSRTMSDMERDSEVTPATMERWHEVVVSGLVDPKTTERLIIVSQNDVSARVWAERQLAMVVEAEHSLLENIFPMHVIEHIALMAASAAARSCGQRGEDSEAGGPGGGPLESTRRGMFGRESQPGMLSSAAKLREEAPGFLRGNSPVHITGDTFLHLATSHSALTLLFCDIQGFTTMCNIVKPATVMAFLNELYTRLDSMLDAFGVYKVETIGDCYVAAGGLMKVDEETGAVTVRSDDVDPKHANRTVEFAKALLLAASKVRLPTTGEPVRLRVGIHSGPAMSGVVGTRMPRFCLFGDTINTASRMESTGVPGAIHVSQATHDLVPDEAWEATGGVEAKGKGTLQTYLLKPDL